MHTNPTAKDGATSAEVENAKLWACLRNLAQVINLTALDEHLEAETRDALSRCVENQLSAHGLSLPKP